MLAVATDRLSKRRSPQFAVRDVALRIPQRSVYGFLGPNGAGKTTVLRLLLGLLRPDAGRITLLGHDLATDRCAAVKRVGALIEGPSLYDHLSGRDNLEVARLLLKAPRSEIDRVLEIVDMRASAKERVEKYSYGMKQRLGLARALIGSPHLLLLDEPTNGLDPDGVLAMQKLLRLLPAQFGVTVLISSHHLAEVEAVADHVGIMRAGSLIVQADLSTLEEVPTRVTVATDRAEDAAALLRTKGFAARSLAQQVVEIWCERVTMSSKMAAANSLLVNAGHPVWSIMPTTRSLERLYLDACHTAACERTNS